jgi:1-deoxy-D-xylulose-5-phosphate reductoisomerase
MKEIAILGATGSIGASALDVIARHPQRFRATVLSAHSRVGPLIELCRTHRPRHAVIADPAGYRALVDGLSSAGLATRAHAGPQVLAELAAGPDCDTVVAAIVGAAGLPSVLAAAAAGKRLLLANKEVVVVAGDLLLQALRDGGGELLPIDSEHNAIFQCLPPAAGASGRSTAGVRRILLTASGGPFRGWSAERLATVSPAQACAHPNWSMGQKISVDSASLMNKGLEVIEAHWLFGLPAAQIDVVVHPQSIVHSLVDYADGSMLAQLGNPDMRTALAYGLGWPERLDAGVAPLELAAIGQLQFEPPDRSAFPCLDLAYSALAGGLGASTVLNAANEVAVAAFLAGRIGFTAIPALIQTCLERLGDRPPGNLDDRLALDAQTRRLAAECSERLPSPAVQGGTVAGTR